MDLDFLKSLVTYNPDTGIFIWNQRPLIHFKNEKSQKTVNTSHAGKVAGTVAPSTGYIYLGVFRKMYAGHRLAWLWMVGEDPDGEIDHINGVRNDNRWSNLRLVTPAQNKRNAGIRRDNKSGRVGVHFSKRRGMWHAYIGVDGKTKNLGLYVTREAAVAAREKAELAYGYTQPHERRVAL